MKLKALVLALFVAGVGASFALADDGGTGSTTTTTSTSTSGGHGKSAEHGKAAEHSKSEEHGKKDAKAAAACHQVSLVLKGTFVSAAADSFVMNVTKGNHHASALAGKPATIGVDSKTKVKRHGHATLADLKAGDRLHVKVRGCKGADLAAAKLVASKVDAHPAGDAADDEDKDEQKTTTTATTTTTTAKP